MMQRLKDSPVENHRPLRVVVIGAGYSGIYAAIRLSQRIRHIDLTLYEKNPTFGGTWYENRYPGCACDVPSHSYQYTFEPNPAWSSWYAPAGEIQAYLESVAKKYSIDRHTKFESQVQACTWDEAKKRWLLEIKDLKTREVFEDEANILIAARGFLNNPAWPDISGLETFRGKLLHSAIWDESYDFENKRIGIIGSGSSSIQIVPKLQKLTGTKLTCFVRSKTWISPGFGNTMLEQLGRDNESFTSEDAANFAADPSAYRQIRKLIESSSNSIHSMTLCNTALSATMRADFTSRMHARLSAKPSLASHIIPSFAPGCRRLTPGPGYLEALTESNVTFLPTPISHITSGSVVLTDNTSVQLDALVCATGFHTSSIPLFPVKGTNGQLLSNRFTPIPESYMTVAVDGFPNYFMLMGPNSAIGSGSLTMMIESMGDYIVKCVRKIQKEDLASMSVKPARVRDWQAYCEDYFKGTVYLDECRSWYRMGDRITGLWPGSTLHAIEALRSPRWEDWEYEQERSTNALAWLGNGWSEVQLREGGDLAWYLEEEFVDVPKAGKPEQSRRYQLQAFSH